MGNIIVRKKAEIEEEKRKREELASQPTAQELLMLAVADLDVQREIDKTEQQIAMAELAETLIGGSF